MQTEKEKVEALMVPRYKIVGDYPNRPHTMPVGHILKLDKYGAGKWWHEYTDMEPIHIDEGSTKYPLVLRPLSWHEERKVEDMPEYVRFSKSATGRVVKAEKWKTTKQWGMEFRTDDEDVRRVCSECSVIPATSTEYNQYIQSK